MDVSPYKLSAFAGYNESSVKSIDTMKFILVIYTAYCVLINCQKFKSVEQIFRMQNIYDNFTDLMIIFL